MCFFLNTISNYRPEHVYFGRMNRDLRTRTFAAGALVYLLWMAYVDDPLASLEFLRATHYVALSSVVVLFYDYLLCLPSEIQYIWHSRWNLGKWLYLLNRYIPTVDLAIHLNTFLNPNASLSFCRNWFYIDVTLSWISLAIIELLLTFRTIALYQQSRSVSMFISSLATLTMMAMAFLIAVICIRIRVQPVPSYLKMVITGCWYVEDPITLGGVWTCPIVFETAVCIATITKAVQHLRAKTLKHSPLFWALYRDGFLCFFVIFGIALANLFVWYLVPLALGQLLIMLYRASMCVMASRIMLNLRRAGAKTSRGADLGGGAGGSSRWDWVLAAEIEVSHVNQMSATHVAHGQPSAIEKHHDIGLARRMQKRKESKSCGEAKKLPPTYINQTCKGDVGGRGWPNPKSASLAFPSRHLSMPGLSMISNEPSTTIVLNREREGFRLPEYERHQNKPHTPDIRSQISLISNIASRDYNRGCEARNEEICCEGTPISPYGDLLRRKQPSHCRSPPIRTLSQHLTVLSSPSITCFEAPSPLSADATTPTSATALLPSNANAVWR